MPLLSSDFAICLHIDVLVGLQDGDFVVWELGTNVTHQGSVSNKLQRNERSNVRESLDQLVFMSDLAALVCNCLLRSTTRSVRGDL